MPDCEIAVLGAGPGGCAAAVQCRRLGVAPLLIDASGEAGGLVANGYLVENYPGLEAPLPGKVFADRLGRHLRRFGVEVRRASVRSVVRAGDRWRLEGDEMEATARCLILATGTAPRLLSIGGKAGMSGEGVFFELRRLLDAHPAPRRVLVVGGGEAAFDYALSLAGAGAAVAILVRSERVRARGRLVDLVAGRPAISVERNTRIEALEPAEGGVRATLETPGGMEVLEADAVLAAVGRSSTVPSLVEGLAGAAGPTPLEAAPGLYICGDARLGTVGQAGIAVGDGLEAAAAAVGRVAGDGPP